MELFLDPSAMILRNVCYVLLFFISLINHHQSTAQTSDFIQQDISAIPLEVQRFKPAPHVRWNRGSISLDSGHRLVGYFSYDHQQQILLYFDEGKVDAITAFKLKSFTFFDQQLKQFRKYQVLPMKHSRQIFELLSVGKYRLLRQEHSSSAAYQSHSTRENPKFRFKYFVWDGEKVWTYQQFRHNLHAITKKGFHKMIIPNISTTLSFADRQEIINALNRLSDEDQHGLPKLALKK